MELKFIGDRSGILGTIMTPCGKFRGKMTKIGQKLIKIAKLRCFFFVNYPYLFLLHFCGRWIGGDARPPVAPTGLYLQAFSR